MTYQEAVTMPASHPITGLFPDFQRDPLDLLERSREYGDVVRMRFLHRYNYVPHHPEAIQEILVKKVDKFRRDPFTSSAFRPFTGEGLLLSEGDYWKRQRKMMQPAFHTQRIQHYADTIVEHTEKLMQDWQTSGTRDIQADMVHLTSGIVGLTLFGQDASADSGKIGALLGELNGLALKHSQQLVQLPLWIPTAHNRAINRLVSAFDKIVMRFIEARQKTMEDTGDLLSMLLLSEDEQGEAMSAQEVRNEAVTIFLAGNDTTAVTMTWALYLLSQYPDVVAKIRAEVEAVAPGRALQFTDLPQLPYMDAVVKEVQRLYPVTWAFSRECIEDTDIAGYRIPKNSLITLSPWTMHRNPELWENPLAFTPERFLEGNDIPKYAYFPFGGGQRICIGNNFAMMEMRLILASIVRQMDLAYAGEEAPKPNPLIVLQPDKRVMMQVKQVEFSF